MSRLDRKLQVTWAELKALATKKLVGLHSYETLNATEVYIIEDGKPSFWTAVFKSNDERYNEDERADWEANWLPNANGPTKPRDYDGRDKVQPVTLPTNQWHYWHSIGDTSTGLRDGERFELSHAEAEDASVTWQYRDPVWMAGGRLKYSGAVLGDWVSFTVFAPATEVVANEGNTGNANLVFPGIIVPAAGDGAYDVDLDAAHPVPAPGADGYWDYELPANMKFAGTVTPSSTPGAAKYHLIAARFDLTKFVAEEGLLGEGMTTYEPQNINASLCLPEWRFECVAHNADGEHTLEMVWRVLVSRYWTSV
jgi:hypothetical protein